MDAREIILELMELAKDMDYADYEDTFEEEVDICAEQLEDIRDTALFYLIERVAECNQKNCRGVTVTAFLFALVTII